MNGLMGRSMPNVFGDGRGSAHSPQRACASETFPPLQTLGQVLVPGMRGLASRALA